MFKKNLIISPSWVGDLIMSQALFKLLKSQDQDCSIDVFANKILHPLLERMPEVDNCLLSPFGHGELKLVERIKIAKELCKNYYTHSYVMPNSFKSALIPFFANIHSRTGWIGEFRYGLLNDIRLSVSKIPTMIERFVALGVEKGEKLPDPLPLPRLVVSKNQLDKTINNLKVQILVNKAKPILALCPGAEYGITKQWPAMYFAEIAKVKKNEGWDVWIFGGSKDKVIAQEIQEHSKNSCLDLTEKTNLGEAADLLSLTTLVVTNDSGLMHVAAALDKPIVAIYGSTSPKFTPPLIDKKRIVLLNLPCSPCFKRECPLKHMKCMYDLQPERVLQAIDELKYDFFSSVRPSFDVAQDVRINFSRSP